MASERSPIPIEPDGSAIPAELLERRLLGLSLERVARVSLILGIIYLPVAVSHLLMMPREGRWTMFGVALASAAVLFGLHLWVNRHRRRIDAIGPLAFALYACVVTHSLVRLNYARDAADTVYVGVLTVGMALLPGRIFAHAAWVVGYVAGWCAIMVRQEGFDALRPFTMPLLVTIGISIVIRYIELRSERRLIELQLLEGARKREMVRKAQHDALTGLPNRGYFADRLAEAFEAARRGGDPNFAVLHFDIDRFKLVNESLGHQVGDQLLRAVSTRLLRFVRPGDTVARLGGDEFIVLLSDLRAPEDALVVAERMQTVLAEPFHLDDYEVQLDASVGIALHRPEYQTAAEMLRDADIAVGAAKKQPERQQVFDGVMHEEALERLELEVDLRRGLKRDELVVYYQPIVDAETRRLVGFEALVRWQHPSRGLIGPWKFLGVAEESGLVVELGRWVLERACRDLAELQASWSAADPLHVSVNMSAKQFLHAEAERHLHECLEQTGTPPEQLWIEITETTVLDRPKEAEERIARLADLGVKVCVDDFGVGYSSLGYLQRMSFSVLKLDRAFVEGGARNEAIVAAVVTLARGLGMTVVAEGIESDEQLERVTRLGCPLAQGFIFERAVPLERACALARMARFDVERGGASPPERRSLN